MSEETALAATESPNEHDTASGNPDTQALPDLRFHATRIADLQAQIEELEAPIKAELKELRDRLKEAREDARSAVKNHFAATGFKKFDCGFGMRVSRSYVYDTRAAFQWALKYMPKVLVVDDKLMQAAISQGYVDSEFDFPYERADIETPTIPSESALAEYRTQVDEEDQGS